jgi:hypothetical protein
MERSYVCGRKMMMKDVMATCKDVYWDVLAMEGDLLLL